MPKYRVLKALTSQSTGKVYEVGSEIVLSEGDGDKLARRDIIELWEKAPLEKPTTSKSAGKTKSETQQEDSLQKESL